MAELSDVLIIGAGPAGMTAAVYAARANMSVLLLDALAPGGNIINTNEIANYLGTGTINGAELAMQMFAQVEENAVRFEYATAREISEKDGFFEVSCQEGGIFAGRALIIATGTRPRSLKIPGEAEHSGAGISWCAICDGAQYKGKDVVVIGGGNSAVEESIYLAGIVNRLTVVTMLDLTADPSACDKLRAMPNVEIIPWQEVLEFTGGKKLEGVRIRPSKNPQDERLVPCDGAFEYIGLEPTTGFCENLHILDKRGFIPVNANMETERPGIYAAGDITVKNLRQVATACGDGAIAGHCAAGYVEKNRK